MNNSIIIDEGTENLLERLEAAKVLACKSDDLCYELLEKCCISKDELFEAESTVLIKHKPVCINGDGAKERYPINQFINRKWQPYGCLYFILLF